MLFPKKALFAALSVGRHSAKLLLVSSRFELFLVSSGVVAVNAGARFNGVNDRTGRSPPFEQKKSVPLTSEQTHSPPTTFTDVENASVKSATAPSEMHPSTLVDVRSHTDIKSHTTLDRGTTASIVGDTDQTASSALTIPSSLTSSSIIPASPSTSFGVASSTASSSVAKRVNLKLNSTGVLEHPGNMTMFSDDIKVSTISPTPSLISIIPDTNGTFSFPGFEKDQYSGNSDQSSNNFRINRKRSRSSERRPPGGNDQKRRKIDVQHPTLSHLKSFAHIRAGDGPYLAPSSCTHYGYNGAPVNSWRSPMDYRVDNVTHQQFTPRTLASVDVFERSKPVSPMPENRTFNFEPSGRTMFPSSSDAAYPKKSIRFTQNHQRSHCPPTDSPSPSSNFLSGHGGISSGDFFDNVLPDMRKSGNLPSSVGKPNIGNDFAMGDGENFNIAVVNTTPQSIPPHVLFTATASSNALDLATTSSTNPFRQETKNISTGDNRMSTNGRPMSDARPVSNDEIMMIANRASQLLTPGSSDLRFTLPTILKKMVSDKSNITLRNQSSTLPTQQSAALPSALPKEVFRSHIKTFQTKIFEVIRQRYLEQVQRNTDASEKQRKVSKFGSEFHDNLSGSLKGQAFAEAEGNGLEQKAAEEPRVGSKKHTPQPERRTNRYAVKEKGGKLTGRSAKDKEAASEAGKLEKNDSVSQGDGLEFTSAIQDVEAIFTFLENVEKHFGANSNAGTRGPFAALFSVRNSGGPSASSSGTIGAIRSGMVGTIPSNAMVSIPSSFNRIVSIGPSAVHLGSPGSTPNPSPSMVNSGVIISRQDSSGSTNSIFEGQLSPPAVSSRPCRAGEQFSQILTGEFPFGNAAFVTECTQQSTQRDNGMEGFSTGGRSLGSNSQGGVFLSGTQSESIFESSASNGGMFGSAASGGLFRSPLVLGGTHSVGLPTTVAMSGNPISKGPASPLISIKTYGAVVPDFRSILTGQTELEVEFFFNQSNFELLDRPVDINGLSETPFGGGQSTWPSKFDLAKIEMYNKSTTNLQPLLRMEFIVNQKTRLLQEVKILIQQHNAQTMVNSAFKSISFGEE